MHDERYLVNSEAESRPLKWVVDIGFIALMVSCAIRYYSIHPFTGTGVTALALAAAATVSYLIGAFGRRDSLLCRVGVVAAAVLWVPLVWLAPSFSWAAFALFFALFQVLPVVAAQWCAAAVVGAVCVALFRFSGGNDIGLVLGPLLGGIVLFTVFRQLHTVLAQRTALLTDLVRTQEVLAEREREAGALTERSRVAAELHDTVVQHTASALLLLEAASPPNEFAPAPTSDAEADADADADADGHSAADTDPVTLGHVETAQTVLRRALRETRELMHGLTSQQSAHHTFVDQIRELSNQFGAECEVHGAVAALPPEHQHALLRIVQESLRNVQQHAGNAHSRVTVNFFPDAIAVDIADNGKGFTPDIQAHTGELPHPGSEAPGYGIRAMQWRAQQLGGTLSVESEPGAGTVIAVNLPRISHEKTAHPQ